MGILDGFLILLKIRKPKPDNVRWFGRGAQGDKRGSKYQQPETRRLAAKWSQGLLAADARAGGSTEVEILAHVWQTLTLYATHHKRDFMVSDLLASPRVIEHLAKVMCNVEMPTPIGPSVIKGHSWLYKVGDDIIGMYINVDTTSASGYVTIPSTLDDWGNEANLCHVLDYLSIVAHEMGHLVLRHNFKKIEALRDGALYPAMDKTDEYEAWLFSEYLRGFILGEHAWQTKNSTGRDGAPHLFLHRRSP